MNQEEILYNHYLTYLTKRRDEAIKLLEERNFSLLISNYVHFYVTKEKRILLENINISKVIEQLSNIKIEANETEPFLNCEPYYNSLFEPIAQIEIVSYLYSIEPFEKCESLARNYTKDALFKLKNQPNGKEAKRYEQIIANANIV